MTLTIFINACYWSAHTKECRFLSRIEGKMSRVEGKTSRGEGKMSRVQS